MNRQAHFLCAFLMLDSCILYACKEATVVLTKEAAEYMQSRERIKVLDKLHKKWKINPNPHNLANIPVIELTQFIEVPESVNLLMKCLMK